MAKLIELFGRLDALQFLIVAASIGIILWLVSALCNGGFDKHFEQISSVNRTRAACMQYREIAVDRCPHR